MKARTTLTVVLASACLLVAGCATAPQPAASPAATQELSTPPVATVEVVQQLSGRLNLRVRRPSTGATDGGTLMFEFEGNESRGRLLLQTVIGTTVAQVRWAPEGAEIATPQGSRSGARLDDVAGALLGESLPLAALLHWIRAEPWSGAPHRLHAEGFEQLGWQVFLNAWHERVVTARRPARSNEAADTEITVWARLDTADPKSGTPAR